MAAYYNEHDPFAAAWLRELIKAGTIAPGEVDERSIEDVLPTDLTGFHQCHFFAGIGVWSYALRLAGVPDDFPIWTGSCPCQPFSQAGKGKGFADERHLWPAWFHLIEQCGPAIVFGEQVADRDGLTWFDLVSADMEALGYAIGTAPAPSAGFGAPHIRMRNFWVADADDTRPQGRLGMPECADQLASRARGLAGGLADTSRIRPEMALLNTGSSGTPRCVGQTSISGMCSASGDRPGPTNGLWGNADWLGCRDGKWRPVEPCTFPLVDGTPSRVGRLRGYGNAVNARQAQAFIEAAMMEEEEEGDRHA